MRALSVHTRLNQKKKGAAFYRLHPLGVSDFVKLLSYYLFLSAAWADASLAIGTLNGEHET